MTFRVTCPKCRVRDRADARFCRLCGTPLSASFDASLRRFVTIVRSDVVGSTGLGERYDPELVRRLLKKYYNIAQSVCTYHGGVIEQIQGDAVIAVFDGHEDDALRAVRAAAELRDRVTRLNLELERDAGIRLPIRTAIESGDVVAGPDGPGQLAGDVMNVVARLEKEAGPGEIVLGESTFGLVREAVDVEVVGPFILKGKEKPVPAYRLLVVPPGVTERAHLAVPMVGREPELAMLQAAYDRAASDRTCHVITLLGAAGVGKSRLIQEVLRSIQGPAMVFRGRCPPYGGVVYDAMIQVVIEAAGLELEDPPMALQRLMTLVAGVDGEHRIVERVGQALGLRKGAGPPEDTHWALRRLLEVLARERPLIVVLEDLHWADAALLDLIEEIAESSRDAPLLLVCAARLELLDARRRWAGGKVNSLCIQLAPLDANETKQLVHQLLGDVAMAPEVSKYIVDRSGGNPLFVQGFMAMLREKRLLRVGEARWRAAVEQLEVPRDIQAVITTRIAHLDVAERRVVERAAIVAKVGRQFTEQAILELSSSTERSQLAASLRTLVRKGLVVPDFSMADNVKGEEGFAFAHALIQEVAYQAVGKETRAELHERFADWLNRTSGGDLAQVEEIIGHHLELAYRCLVDLGWSDERTMLLARRAGKALAMAGHRAAARRDIPKSAVSLLHHAESLLKGNDELRRTVLLDLADSLRDSRLPQRALEVYARAIEEADAVGDEQRVMHGYLGAWAVKGFLGLEDEGVGRGRDTLENALHLFSRIKDDSGLAKAWHAKAYAHWMAGRLDRAEEACRRAIKFARDAGDEPLEAGAVSSRCFILFWGPRDLEEVGSSVMESLTWARSRGIRSLEVDTLRILARIAAMQHEFLKARALLSEANNVDKSEASGDLLVLVGEYLSTAIVELMAGEWVEAERVLRQGYDIVADLRGTGQLVSVIILLARALAMQGRDEEAMEKTNECERLALESQRDAQVKWRAIRALLLARRGDLQLAERLAEEAVDRTVGWEQDDSTAEVLADHAHVLRLAGKEEDARRRAELALTCYERKGNHVGVQRVRTFLEREPTQQHS